MTASTLSELIRTQARKLADHPAYITPTRRWTFADVDAESNRLAQGLKSLGVGPGDRVGCLTKHMAECITLLFACAKIGAVCSPYNWRLASAELEYMIDHSEARILLTDRFMLPTLAQVAAPKPVRTLVIDGTEDADDLAAFRSGFAAQDPGFVGEPTDTVLQLYSSGTTGVPKGVELTHAGLLPMCGRIDKLFEEGFDGRPLVQLNVLPTFHVSGTVNALWTVFAGATTVAYPEFDPPSIIEAIAKHQVTCTFMVPAMMLFLLRTPGIESADLSSLKIICYGGSPIGEQLLTEVMEVIGCGLVQVYGSTEFSGTATMLSAADHRPSPTRSDLLRSAGKPMDGVELRIVDPASFIDCEEGQVGEVWVRTPTLMKGYFRNEKATNDVFPLGRDSLGGWFRSGDAGYMRNGYLYIHDRIKDMVISGGENVYPAEVENVVANHPAVAEVAVIGVPDPVWGEAVKACVVLKQGVQASEAEIIAFTRERLAHYKCPKSVDFFSDLPRNPSGKLLKRQLRQPYWPDQVRQVG